MTFNRYMLEPCGINQKSFYGKAYYTHDKDTGDKTLYSYHTKICTYNVWDKTLTIHWGGWSATTARHMVSFLNMLFGEDFTFTDSYKNFKALMMSEGVHTVEWTKLPELRYVGNTVTFYNVLVH